MAWVIDKKEGDKNEMFQLLSNSSGAWQFGLHHMSVFYGIFLQFGRCTRNYLPEFSFAA